ncbi:MAG: KAP family P-loop NTPase fold protein [Actinomycetota bacterium]
MAFMVDSSDRKTTQGLLGDDPVADEAHDALARGEFAKRVADLVDQVAADTPSAVLSLLGPWGSGKTSVLHFVRRRLEGRERWRVVEFNPWMVSDLPSLVQEFFTTLVAALPEDSKGKKLRQKMAGYAKAVSPFATPFKLFGINADEAILAAGEVLAGDQSIGARRRELEDALRGDGAPILLVADDLDRLHPDELTLIFKLVRLVGRLPNVYYLLAFDEETVLDVLTSTALAGGDRSRALAYLEKMVQVRLELPPVHVRLAGQLLDQLLDAVIAKHGVTLDAQASNRLAHAYRTHLASYLREPRQVKHYCAQIEALYPLVASEVDFVDFAIITFLRTFHPGVTGTLIAHKAELTGTSFRQKLSQEERRNAWREQLKVSDVPDTDIAALLELLGQMFLPIKSALERMEYGSGFYPELASSRRVGSSEYFDRYFYLGIGPDDLPDATVARALDEALSGSPGDAWSAVIAMLPTDAEMVLDKLRRFAPTTANAAHHLLPLLAEIETQVPDTGLFGRARFVHRSWASDLILLAKPDDAASFAGEIAAAAGVRFLAHTVTRAKRSAEKKEQTTSASFGSITVETLRLIKEELDRQSAVPPQDTSNVNSLLTAWGALEPEADRRTWMRSRVESGAWPLPDLLGVFVPIGTSSAGGPSWPSLGDADLACLEQVLGSEYAAAQLGDSPEPGEEPDSADTDVSWEARLARAKRAVAHWMASNEPAAPVGDGGDAE